MPRRLLLAAFVAAALAFPLVAPRFAPRPEADLAAALARATGLPAAQVSLARFTVRPPGEVIVGGLRVGPLRIDELRVAADLWAMAGGKRRARRVEAERLRLDTAEATLEVQRLAALVEGRTGRATLEAISGRVGGLAVQAPRAELARRPAALRLLVPAATVDGLGALAVVAAAGPEGVALRARRTGLSVEARRHGGRWQARLAFDGLPLATAAPLLPPPLAVSAGRVSGTLTAVREAGDSRADAALTLSGLVFSHPALGHAPIGPLDLTLEAAAGAAGAERRVDVTALRVGELVVSADARWQPAGPLAATVRLAPVPCAAVLRSLPPALLPTLDGLVTDGRLAARVAVAGRTDDLAHLSVDPTLEVGCRVVGDAPLADPTPLRDRRLAVHGGGAHGRGYLLDPAGVDWAPIETIPDAVARTFVLAEDGRFFTHRGFDLARLNRAVGANLAEGRFGRGASTISQQVAKNLFLSGERSLGRKLEEAVLTWRLEQLLDKRRILELYLNLVELGPGVRGVRAAARHHFGKELGELGEAEAAKLAALLPAPHRGFDEAWRRRHAALLARLPGERLVLPWQKPSRPLRLSRVSARGGAARPR